MLKKLLAALFVITSGAFFTLTANEIIAEISFNGLGKTRPDHLRQFIVSTEGAVYDQSRAERDAQNLRNIGLFTEVTLSTKESPDGYYITFNCTELITLLPIINLGGLSDNFWYQLGAMDINWLGRGNTLGGYYRYYDRHSFAAFLELPRLIGKRWGITTSISHISTIEPAFFEDGSAQYDVDNQAYLASIRYNLGTNSRIELGGGLLEENYLKNLERSDINSPGPDEQSFTKWLIKLSAMQESIDYFYHYLNGYSNEIFLETVRTEDEEGGFWKVLNISKLFKRIKKKGNWASRMRLGLSTNKQSPFVPFVLDSYLTARGSGNRSSRGTAEFTINTEYRHSVFERKSGAIQTVVFLDASAWRPAAGTVKSMFNRENNVTLAGIGGRLYLKRFNNLIIRADYGVSLTTDGQHGVVFGIGQYF